MNKDNFHHEQLRQQYQKSKKEADRIQNKCKTTHDPLGQTKSHHETIVPKRRRLMDDYFERMKQNNTKPMNTTININYMSSTVFTEDSDINCKKKNMRGFNRQEQEKRSQEIKPKCIRTFPKQRTSPQVDNVLNHDTDNKDTDVNYHTNEEPRRQKSCNQSRYPFHFQNTFARFRNGDNTYDLQFRSKYLYKPQNHYNVRKDNINDIFQYQLPKNNNPNLNTISYNNHPREEEEDNDKEYLQSIKPNQIAYSRAVALTEAAIKHNRFINNY